MTKEIAQLKAYILYMLMLPEWPSKDFGHFVDHFGSFAGSDWETGDYRVVQLNFTPEICCLRDLFLF